MFSDFYGEVKQLIEKSSATATKAICCIDIDDFNSVNEHYGYEAGDIVLETIHHRLKAISQIDEDVVIRGSGDQFYLLLQLDGDIERLTTLIHVISEVIHLNEHLISVHASIGVYLIENTDTSTDAVIRKAFHACIIAKNKGGNNLIIYDSEQNDQRTQWNQIVNSVIKGLGKSQFSLYLQPKYHAHNSTLVGYEALIRWNHPERGVVPPDQFLPHIKNTEAEIMLDQFVLESAIRIIAILRQYGNDLTLSINVTPRQLVSPWFFKQLHRLHNKHPDYLKHLFIEILETDSFENIGLVKPALMEYLQMGIRFSLDDFGVGYASLTHLVELPIAEVKIDRFFISNIEHHHVHQLVVKSVVQLAKDLELITVAEGVETEQEFNALKALGIDVFQGYLLGRPFPSEQLIRNLNTLKQSPTTEFAK